jgi:hypothetical protein
VLEEKLLTRMFTGPEKDKVIDENFLNAAYGRLLLKSTHKDKFYGQHAKHGVRMHNKF